MNISILAGILIVLNLFVYPILVIIPTLFQELQNILEQDKRVTIMLPEHFEEFRNNVENIQFNVNQMKEEVIGTWKWEAFKKRQKNYFISWLNWLIPTNDDTYTERHAESKTEYSSKQKPNRDINQDLKTKLLKEDTDIIEAIRKHVLGPLETNTENIKAKYQRLTRGN